MRNVNVAVHMAKISSGTSVQVRARPKLPMRSAVATISNARSSIVIHPARSQVKNEKIGCSKRNVDIFFGFPTETAVMRNVGHRHPNERRRPDSVHRAPL